MSDYFFIKPDTAFGRLLSSAGSWINSYKVLLSAALAVFIVYFFPHFALGKNAYITIHDNLDGELVYKYLLATTGQAFNYSSDAVIPNVMNGLPRSAYRSADISLLFFYALEPYAAYIANHVIVHLIAFAGMFLLLKKHVLKEDPFNYVAAGVSLCFGLIPFYTQFGISVAGQPLLLYAFLNFLRNDYKPSDYLVIIFFPFYCHFVLAGPFIMVGLALLYISACAQQKSINKPFLGAFLLLAGTFVIAELQLFKGLVNPQTFVSHRTTWNRWNDLDTVSNLRTSADIFLNTQYHAGTLHTKYIAFCAIVAALITATRGLNRYLAALAAVIVLICLEGGFYDWIAHYAGAMIKMFRYANFSRFYFLLPLLWMLLFAVSLREILRLKNTAVAVAAVLILQLWSVINSNEEFKNNLKLELGRPIDNPTYSEFFSKELFIKIDRHINLPKSSYRVVSIGLHPSIAQMNDFFTLDSYQVNYDLHYKERFREIIAPELAKDEQIRDYFDGWGNRCYVFTSELGKGTQYRKNGTTRITNLDIDTAALKTLGGKYIFSAVEITNHAAQNLAFEGRFQDGHAFSDIWLYKVM